MMAAQARALLHQRKRSLAIHGNVLSAVDEHVGKVCARGQIPEAAAWLQLCSCIGALSCSIQKARAIMRNSSVIAATCGAATHRTIQSISALRLRCTAPLSTPSCDIRSASLPLTPQPIPLNRCVWPRRQLTNWNENAQAQALCSRRKLNANQISALRVAHVKEHARAVQLL